jgi:hypothetical protein
MVRAVGPRISPTFTSSDASGPAPSESGGAPDLFEFFSSPFALAARAPEFPSEKPKNPRLQPAYRVIQELGGVEQLLRRATSDEQIDRTERRKISDRISRARERAEELVPKQGDEALRALHQVQSFNQNGRLEVETDRAFSALASAKSATWRDARADAHRDPFKHLHGFDRAFPGVRTKDVSFEGKRAHIVAIDLADGRVRVDTNGRRLRGQSPDQIGQKTGAEVAINGDFFSYGSYKPSGLAMVDDKRWPDTVPGSWHGTVFMNGRHVKVARQGDEIPSWAEDAVSGRPAVLANGKVITNYSSEPDKARPSRRTGVGLSEDGRVLYLVAVESPISAQDLGRLMKRYGAADGISSDSGGSAQMYIRGRGRVQGSSDPGGRRGVANTILIQAG